MLIWSRRFLTDYFHTAIILIIACYFSIKAFTIDEVGSIGKLYDLVQAAAQRHPVSGNHDGTYLTMTSKGVGWSHVATPATLTLALGDALWDPAHLLELWFGNCRCNHTCLLWVVLTLPDGYKLFHQSIFRHSVLGSSGLHNRRHCIFRHPMGPRNHHELRSHRTRKPTILPHISQSRYF